MIKCSDNFEDRTRFSIILFSLAGVCIIRSKECGSGEFSFSFFVSSDPKSECINYICFDSRETRILPRNTSHRCDAFAYFFIRDRSIISIKLCQLKRHGARFYLMNLIFNSFERYTRAQKCYTYFIKIYDPEGLTEWSKVKNLLFEVYGYPCALRREPWSRPSVKRFYVFN